MAINWTKLWQAADDGRIIGGADLRTLQDDIDADSVTTPVSDSDLSQITTAEKVHASAITGMVFYENDIISYENELVSTT